MKKILPLFLLLLLALPLLSGCGETASARNTDVKPHIVTTVFPEYDWVREILGERSGSVELSLLLDNGVDLHSYQPSAADMAALATCDMLVFTGGESSAWIKDALAGAGNPNMIVIELLDVLGDAVKEEELVEGMQAEEEEEGGYDEHVWLSLRNAAAACGYIAEKLCQLDPSGRAVYAANAAAYIEKLDALDAQYAQAVRGAARRTVLFGDRFPFRYLADDYGLEYFAAFAGCSAETEASFETVVFLANKVDELGLSTVLTIESSDGKLAQTIIDSTSSKNARILQMDSLQSVTASDVAGGMTYLGVMERNLEVLRLALA